MPEYGKPIENNLHFKSLVDFFKDEPSDDSEESTPFPMAPVTDAEHPEGAGVPLYDRNGALHPGGFTPDEWVGMLRQSPTSEKGIWNSEWYKNVEPYVAAPRKAPKSDVENSLLKLMKAPVTGDDEAKWNDPRNTPENFPGNEERTNYQGKKFRANELKIPSEEVDVEISEPGPRSFMDRLRGREGEPVTRTETQRQASQRKIELPGARAGLHADFIGGRSKQGGVESYNALGDWRASQGDPNWQKNQIEYYRDNPHLLPTMEEEAASPRRRRFPQQNEPQIYQNSVEKALLKLMKGGDAQKLNAMDNPPKENKDSQALVADGDSKRPKSEVGTNDKMFQKANGFQAGEGPTPHQSDKARRWAKIKRDVETRRANQAKQNNLPGFEPDPPEEEPPTPDQLEHNVLKVMEHPEERPQRATDRLSIKRLQQLRQGDTTGPEGSKRVAPELSYTSFNAEPHTVPEDLPVKVRNSVENTLEKLMGEEARSRQDMETGFPVRHPDDTIDPTIRVSSRTGIDAPVLPDPTHPETHAEELQREAESVVNRSTRGGRESGAMGLRRGTPVPDYRPGRSHMSGGAPERRKTPIGKGDMEKGGSFWGGSRKQNVPQTPPQQEPPWGRKENEASKEAGLDRRIERLTAQRSITGEGPKLGNLGNTRGQRRKSRSQLKGVENSIVKLMKEGEINPEKVGMTRKNALKSLDKANGGTNMGGMANRQVASQPAFADSATQEAQGMDTGVDHGRMANFQSYNAALGQADRAAALPGQAVGAGIGTAKLGAKGVGAIARGIGNLFGGGNKSKPDSNQLNTSTPPGGEPMDSTQKYPEAYQAFLNTPSQPETNPNANPSPQASNVPQDMKGAQWSSGFGPSPQTSQTSGPQDFSRGKPTSPSGPQQFSRGNPNRTPSAPSKPSQQYYSMEKSLLKLMQDVK